MTFNKMRYLFIFAHPDDETVACAGTIKKLTSAKEEVMVVSVTAGDAGEVVSKAAQAKLTTLGSVAALRKTEFRAASQLLGVTQSQMLDFKDGTINNKQVWGQLKETIIELFSQYKPDVVITFDHSGWYYHLDHIGVSIATTLAYHQAQYQPAVLLLSHLHIKESSWNHYYVFAKNMMATHRVDINDVMDTKLAAIKIHDSQNLVVVKKHFQEKTQFEEYILAFASQKGKKWLTNQSIFQMIKN